MKLVNKHSVLSVATGVAVVMSGMTSAMAGTTTGTITVGATTAAACTPPGTYTIALGNYNGISPVTGSANIVFKCTKSTAFTIKLKPNGGVASTSGSLKTSPANTTPILYTLDSDTFTGNGNGLAVSAANIGATSNVTVAAGQNPIPGSYSDTITIEVTY
jgi:spore coat protein U-like protein